MTIFALANADVDTDETPRRQWKQPSRGVERLNAINESAGRRRRHTHPKGR